MTMRRVCFCVECRKETEYRIQKRHYMKCIKEKEYMFEILEAICEECGETVNIPGLMDRNAQEIDKQYRQKEDIVTVEDIKHLMELYHLGKAPLSLALGFGEITITRYVNGQIPSKEYSDVIRNALEVPEFMLKKLQENAGKIGDSAYKKATKAAGDLRPLFQLSTKMLLAISYIFECVEEITPLALQKMLYYVQGIYMALFEEELFEEECLAWAHGPVFRKVYDVFKNFRYNPIDDIRFSMFQNRFHELSDTEKKVIDLVVESFGVYSGKTLEKITHRESPWREAYVPCLQDGRSNEIISKPALKEYFKRISQKYNLDTVEGINSYIYSQLNESLFFECIENT